MTGHDLEKPLKPRARPAARRAPRLDAVAWLAAALAGALAVFGIWAVFVKDPLGGEPIATALIERRAPERPATAEPAAANGQPASQAVSPHAGMPVVRPGDAMPKSGPVIIQIPGADDGHTEAPAGRNAGRSETAMLEDSRYGPLPRIAPDGRRPLDAFARAPAPAVAGKARVALVVGGLGVGRELTQSAMDMLPGEVTLAFSPYGQDVGALVAKARATGHEVLMQAPMEPFGYPGNDTGPQTMLTSLPAPANLERLRWALSRATGYVGVTPLGGGRFLEADGATAPVFTELARRGLMFVGLGAEGAGYAGSAERSGLPNAPAARAIDAMADAASIDASLADLERTAKAGAVAVGWATATPLTLKRIDVWRAGLAARGVALAPVTAALGRQGPS